MKVMYSQRRAVFLDRDGVINPMVYNSDFGLVDSPQNPREFQLLPGVPQAIRHLNEMGVLAVVVSNQPGIAKGKLTPAILEAMNEEMFGQLANYGAHLDGVYYCLHHPEAQLKEYRVMCDCRKPGPGLLYQAAQEMAIDLSASFMVGDGLTDVMAGKAAGCRTVLLGRVKCDICTTMRELDARPDSVMPSLLDAVDLIASGLREVEECCCV